MIRCKYGLCRDGVGTKVKESHCDTQTKHCDSEMWILKYPFEYPYFSIDFL